MCSTCPTADRGRRRRTCVSLLIGPPLTIAHRASRIAGGTLVRAYPTRKMKAGQRLSMTARRRPRSRDVRHWLRRCRVAVGLQARRRQPRVRRQRSDRGSVNVYGVPRRTQTPVLCRCVDAECPPHRNPIHLAVCAARCGVSGPSKSVAVRDDPDLIAGREDARGRGPDRGRCQGVDQIELVRGGGAHVDRDPLVRAAQ